MAAFGSIRLHEAYRPSTSINKAVKMANPPTPLSQRRRADYGQNGVHRMSIITCATSEVATPEAAIIPEDEIIELTKQFADGGFRGSATVGDALADDMIFRGPEVGPLTKSVYLNAVTGFKLTEAFPDIETKAFGFSVDPTDPFRVWFFAQTTGTHTEPWRFPGGSTIPATGGKIQNGTEASSIIWTPDRKVRYISVGYCVDRINSNTPNGTMKVAVAGFLRAAGQGQLWEVINSPVVNWFNDLVSKLQGKPSTQTPFEDLPDWWKELPDSNLKGAEGYKK